MKTNSSMTIYNKRFTAGEYFWQRYVVPEVFWDSTISSLIDKGLMRDDSCIIYVPFNSNYMSSFVDSITFQNNYAGNWTVKTGDIVVKGIIIDEITKQSDLESKYENVFNITGYTINDFGSANMRHIKIVGV